MRLRRSTLSHPASPGVADGSSPEGETILRAEGLKKQFPVARSAFGGTAGSVRAVDGLTFEVRRGETLGLVGETGCGKSTTGMLLSKHLAPTAGRIFFEGTDITRLSHRQSRSVHRDVQMIFQDPYSSLNPRQSVGTILAAPYRIQGVRPPQGITAAVRELLAQVGLNPEHYNRFPHEFSGGQRQRISVARALALRPKMIIADEPVSSLDVSIQAQIVNLLQDLQDEFGLTYIFVAHDLSVVRHIADRVAVMYLGKIVELAGRDELYARPRHPYTHALLSAVPIPDPDSKQKRPRIRLSGELPSPLHPPSGCRFSTQCWKAQEVCREQEPALTANGDGHGVACHFPEPASGSAS